MVPVNSAKMKSEIFQKIENRENIKLTFQYVSDDTLVLLNSIVSRVLSKYDMPYILYSMLTVVREIVVNALKANAKRVFFNKSGYNINDQQDYNRGISSFKDQVVGDFDSIKDDLMQGPYFIQFEIIFSDKGMSFLIKNNVPILPQEQERINQRIAAAADKVNFHEIYDQIEDDTEGAGLGIALVVLFLKSMSGGASTFKIRSDGKITVTSFEVPFNLKPESVTSFIKERILKEIKGVPTFPENVVTLLELCSDPDSNIDDIVTRIKRDVAIVSDVIKLANSAGFITSGKIEDIGKAVMKIGLKNLKSILIASNARKIMESRYSRFEEIWEHCNKVAVYSRLIAEKYKMQGVAENAFLAGLLHDLGQVILLAVDMNAIKKIAEIVHDRNIISSAIMEEISIGISHSEIGALVSENWNFPDYLTQTIRFHHSPQNIQKEYRDIVFTVYLANLLCGIEKKKYYYYYAEDPVLERFKLEGEKELIELHSEIRTKFEKL